MKMQVFIIFDTPVEQNQPWNKGGNSASQCKLDYWGPLTSFMGLLKWLHIPKGDFLCSFWLNSTKLTVKMLFYVYFANIFLQFYWKIATEEPLITQELRIIGLWGQCRHITIKYPPPFFSMFFYKLGQNTAIKSVLAFRHLSQQFLSLSPCSKSPTVINYYSGRANSCPILPFGPTFT